MSQNDYIIANQTAPAFRADLNDALQALASLSSGTSQPATTYANMLWYDTSNNILKMRTEANDAWMNIGYLNQTANAFRVLDNTQVVNTSGSQTGLLGDQATSAWQTGSSTTESLVSPAKVKAAIDALAPETPTTFNGVGTYAVGLFKSSGGAPNANTTYAASGLATFSETGTTVPFTSYGLSGTWRVMTGIRGNGTNAAGGFIAVRIS